MADISSNPMANTQPIQTAVAPQATGTTIGSNGGIDSTLGSTLGSLLGAGASYYGAQNAAEAQTNAELNAITTQQNTLGNINSIYGTQAGTGNAAISTLGNTLGVGGGSANYSNFYNMPGYQFSVGQGTQAIQRAATAGGSAYTPQTLAAIGQYVTGTASQDYNTYVSQLLQTAGLGASANQGLTGANLSVGGNISQLQQNTGNAQASGANALGTSLSGLINGLNSSGSIGGIASGLGNLASGLNYNGTYSPNLSGYSADAGYGLPSGSGLNLSSDQLVSNNDVMNVLNGGSTNGSGTTTYWGDSGDNSGP
jgi:hypothetical protein